jgi:hypothetical protein
MLRVDVIVFLIIAILLVLIFIFPLSLLHTLLRRLVLVEEEHRSPSFDRSVSPQYLCSFLNRERLNLWPEQILPTLETSDVFQAFNVRQKAAYHDVHGRLRDLIHDLT